MHDHVTAVVVGGALRAAIGATVRLLPDPIDVTFIPAFAGLGAGLFRRHRRGGGPRPQPRRDLPDALGRARRRAHLHRRGDRELASGEMVSHAEHTTTSTQPAARILAALTAVALLVGTLLMLGVIPAGALMLLGLAYIARTTR